MMKLTLYLFLLLFFAVILVSVTNEQRNIT
jgi:hypothetical protein